MSAQSQAQQQGQSAQGRRISSNPPSERGSNSGGSPDPHQYKGAALYRHVTEVIENMVLDRGLPFTLLQHAMASELAPVDWSPDICVEPWKFQKKTVWVAYAKCCDIRIKDRLAAGDTRQQIKASIEADTLGVTEAIFERMKHKGLVNCTVTNGAQRLTLSYAIVIPEKVGQGPRAADNPVIFLRLESVGRNGPA